MEWWPLMPSPSLYSLRRLFCHEEGSWDPNLSTRLKIFEQINAIDFLSLLHSPSLGHLTTIAISTFQKVTKKKQAKLNKIKYLQLLPAYLKMGMSWVITKLGLDKEINYCFHSRFFVVTMYTDTYELLWALSLTRLKQFQCNLVWRFQTYFRGFIPVVLNFWTLKETLFQGLCHLGLVK